MLARLVEYDPATLLSVLGLFGMCSTHEFKLRAIWTDKSMCGLFLAIDIITCDIKVKVLDASQQSE
jgi:hypothetical protein